MDELNKPIPDDDFYKSASKTLAVHILPLILAMGVEKDIKPLPSNWLESLFEKYTPEDFDKWVGTVPDLMQPPETLGE